MTTGTPAPHTGVPDGVALIAAERRRQIEVEGWTPEHDTEHDDNGLALAAECYLVYGGQLQPPSLWPWRHHAERGAR